MTKKNLSEGDRLDSLIQEDGDAQRRLSSSIRRLFGIVQHPGMPAPTLEAIDEEIGAYLAVEDERIRSGEE